MTLEWREQTEGKWVGYSGDLPMASVYAARHYWVWDLGGFTPKNGTKLGMAESIAACKQTADKLFEHWLDDAALVTQAYLDDLGYEHREAMERASMGDD